MILHANDLNSNDLYDAARLAGVRIARGSQRGSRSRAHAFDVVLSGSGRTGGQWGGRDEKSATWDEWGVFLAHLFTVDESLTIPHVYESHEHFTWATGGRYEPFEWPQHVQHRWGIGQVNVTHTYSVAECSCGAIRRWMLHGYRFGVLVGVA